MNIATINPAQSSAMTATEAADATSAIKVAAVALTTEQEDTVDVTNGEALFELSSYTCGALLTPMLNGDVEYKVSSTTDASHGLYDQESIGKSSNGENVNKKMGRPSHPAWQYFARGEKRNRFHYNAYCKFCHENGVKPVTVRGVSGNMIRHLQECVYCPAEVVTRLKLLCAQKDAASFNKRHQTRNRGVNVMFQGTSKKARHTETPEKLQEAALRDSNENAVETSAIHNTSTSEGFMPLQLPLISSETHEVLTTATSSSLMLSYDSNLSSVDNGEKLATSLLSNETAKRIAIEPDQVIEPRSSRLTNRTDSLSQLVASSTLLAGLPWDWVWTEQAALTLGNLHTKLESPSAELLSIGTTSHKKQISKMKGEQVGVALAVSWWAAKYPRSNFALLSLVNALGEATSWDLIDMGVGKIEPSTLAAKIKSNLLDLQNNGIKVINIVADTTLTYAASQLGVSSSDQTSSAIPVLPCFSHSLQILLGVVLTGSDSSIKILGEVIEIVQTFSSLRMLNVLRRECGDPEAELHAPSRHDWYSFIEAIDSVRQYEELIKTILAKVIRASSNSRDSAGEFLSNQVNPRKDSVGNTVDELAECIFPGAVLRSIQNEEFWENIVALSELVMPIKETYKMISRTFTSSFPLSDILYQFGRMHQQYVKIREGLSRGGRSVEYARCLLRTIDDLWKLYDQPLVFLGYTFDYRLQSRVLARHQSSLQWISVGKHAKQYFRDWFCAPSLVRNISRPVVIRNEAAAHLMEDMLAYKVRKYPFNFYSTCNFDNPKHFYMLVSDSHPMIHMFGSRLFSMVTSTPYLGDVLPGKCFLPSISMTMCSQHTLLPLLRLKLFAQTASQLSKDSLQKIYNNKLNHDSTHMGNVNLPLDCSESKSDVDEASSPYIQSPNLAERSIMGEANNFSLSRIRNKNEWEAMANEWKAYCQKEIESSNQLPSRAVDSSSPDLTLDQIFTEALPSRLSHDHEDAFVDV